MCGLQCTHPTYTDYLPWYAFNIQVNQFDITFRHMYFSEYAQDIV